ncbi:MAG: type II secretion system F family protein [Thermoflexaceae bacterium]|nr:type II secretion system F family protein [Thermoflexaceae bacterium]
MIVCLVMILIIGTWWIKHRKCRKDLFDSLPRKGNELKFLYPAAYGLLLKFKEHDITFSSRHRKKQIENLNVTAETKDTETLYNIRRISMAMLVILAAAVMGLLYDISQKDSGKIINYIVNRPSYGMDKVKIDFAANGKELSAEIHAMEYSPEEMQKNFIGAYEYLLENIKQENESLHNVTGNLNLLTYIEQYAINVSWMSSAPEVIDVYGNVNNYEYSEEMSQDVVLTAVLSYLDYECSYEIEVCVTAPDLTKEELFVRNLSLMIKENDNANRTEKVVRFPENVDGIRVEYEEKKENYTIILLLLGLVAAGMIFPGMDKDLDGKIKERNKQMLMDYSEIVSKLNILSGAGMSIFKAWEKIVRDYEKKNGKKRFAYEEMKITYHEIQSGISESNAYSNFGKRCNIHEYLKLGALLEQNAKKGGKGLSKMLEEESMQAFEQRKNLARKLGEEAGTKMLFPMIIMLAIVMVIVLIPAFTSFGM